MRGRCGAMRARLASEHDAVVNKAKYGQTAGLADGAGGSSGGRRYTTVEGRIRFFSSRARVLAHSALHDAFCSSAARPKGRMMERHKFAGDSILFAVCLSRRPPPKNGLD